MKHDRTKLYTTTQEYQDACLLADKGRGKQVRLPRDQLKHLLMDHSNMVARLNEVGIYPVTLEENK